MFFSLIALHLDVEFLGIRDREVLQAEWIGGLVHNSEGNYVSFSLFSIFVILRFVNSINLEVNLNGNVLNRIRLV